MSESNGVFQLKNGYWGYRFVLKIDGKTIRKKKVFDCNGQRLKTKKQAIKAREEAIIKERFSSNHKKPITRRTVAEVFQEYCDSGRFAKAYGTIRKQDSLWKNHIRSKFGKRYVDEISVAEINDYLSQLYYKEGRAFGYVEAFLKMFYLIFGQAYSRNYIDVDSYNKLCVNKDSRIRMPKRRVNDDDAIISFNNDQMLLLDEYFKGTNAETAFMLGKYCGLRINECYGLKWSDISFDDSTIQINKQMQYQEGVIKLVPVKTRNANRIIYMAKPLQQYLFDLRMRDVTFDTKLTNVREQKKIFLEDINGSLISSLELLNTLPNGKIQTINSMKFHTRKIKETLDIDFKYHYLRHTYGTRLAEMNTPAHILCNQMGHASSKVTEKYYLAVSKRGIELLLDNLNSF